MGLAGKLVVVGGLAWGATRLVNARLRDVEGDSMRTSLDPGDRVIVLPAAPAAIRPGTVVVVRDPRKPRREILKRVIAVGGQRCELRAGALYLDDVAHDEPYVSTPTIDDHTWDVPSGHVIVLGDNRLASTDSRAFGPVAVDQILALAAIGFRPVRTNLTRPPTPRSAPQTSDIGA